MCPPMVGKQRAKEMAPQSLILPVKLFSSTLHSQRVRVRVRVTLGMVGGSCLGGRGVFTSHASETIVGAGSTEE